MPLLNFYKCRNCGTSTTYGRTICPICKCEEFEPDFGNPGFKNLDDVLPPIPGPDTQPEKEWTWTTHTGEVLTIEQMGNLHILNAMSPLLTQANRATLEHFESARELGLKGRLCQLHKSGIYRQTPQGNVSLIIAACLGKI